jgi:hypothetical protein
LIDASNASRASLRIGFGTTPLGGINLVAHRA